MTKQIGLSLWSTPSLSGITYLVKTPASLPMSCFPTPRHRITTTSSEVACGEHLATCSTPDFRAPPRSRDGPLDLDVVCTLVSPTTMTGPSAAFLIFELDMLVRSGMSATTNHSRPSLERFPNSSSTRRCGRISWYSIVSSTTSTLPTAITRRRSCRRRRILRLH